MFRDESYLKMMNAVAGDKKFRTLTITHLKTHLNAECNAFKKASRKVLIEHYEEGNENGFGQFTYDGAALLNKDKCQVHGMQFTDNKFRHINVIALSFRKPVPHNSDKVAQLAEEVCQEHFELDFQDTFSSSVQDLAASAVSKEL